MINTVLVAIDSLLTQQINAILHHPDFQKLEASWRGLTYLLDNSHGVNNLQVRVLDISWDELSRDVLNAIEFDQSQLFKKIYTDEFDQPGGHPFGLLICDYFVNPKQDETGGNDIYTLQALSGVAAAAFSPCVIGVDPVFFGVNHLSELESVIDLMRIFEHQSYAKWKKLRQETDSRFLNLTLNRFCLRSPYSLLDDRLDGFYFQENLYKHYDYLWGNSVYCLGSVIARSFGQTGWFYELKGTRQDSLQGGVVEGPISLYFEDDVSPFYSKPLCETILKQEHERYLHNLGFIILSKCAYSVLCVFYACRTLYQNQSEKTLPNPIGLSLDTVLCVSRFAHYLKIIARHKIGSFTTREKLEGYLQNWILQYTANSAGNITPEFSAKYPLHYSQVTIREKANKPGYFYGSFQLMPRYFKEQLDETLCLEMRLS